MKKTIIAAAIATVVAAPAMADVSVSGAVEQTFTTVDINGADDWAGSSDNSITFKAAEDLGNGLNAFAQITLDTDGDTTKDEKVGLKGGFGTLVMGRMEDFTEGAVMSTMTLNGTGNFEMTGNAGRGDSAIAYVSPTMNGFHVGIAGYITDADSGDDVNARDMIIAYENGPLSVKVSDEDVENAGQTTAVAVSYAMGDIKVSTVYADRETIDLGDMLGVTEALSTATLGTTGVTSDYDDLGLRLDYTMGNNKITIARTELDLDSVNGVAASWNPTVVGFELTHNFSARTSMYAGWNDVDADLAGIDDIDSTYVGMIHKF